MIVLSEPGTVLRALCLAHGKCGMYASGNGADEGFDELGKAAPWLDEKYLHDLAFGGVYALFDTAAEMRAAFGRTVGDDGPTATNPYDGTARVFALTCNASGQLLTENT